MGLVLISPVGEWIIKTLGWVLIVLGVLLIVAVAYQWLNTRRR